VPINAIIRIGLRLENLGHEKITDTVKGTNLRTKINAILPLLGVELSEQQRQISLNQIPLRNEVTHFKALPELWFDAGEKDGSHGKISNKIQEFFKQYPIIEIERQIGTMFDEAIAGLPHVYEATQLFKRYLG